MSDQPTIIYTKTDVRRRRSPPIPCLIIKVFAEPAGVSVETRDIR